ncbi:MAG: hypothetical protein Q8K59_04955 [Nitrosomonas sp.]|nr:hypothetical protein [Nitrosomonas sp.]MDP1950437.1 hypothetical protein [Nitrosomonas sp.]
MADMEKWSINETLLQSYRSIFISSQSFLLAVGAIVSGKNHIVLYAIAAISLLMIWAIWFPVVRARHRIVDYYKFGARLPEAERTKLCSEKQYVHDHELRKTTNNLFGIETNWRPTRKKLDFMMPVLVSSVWAVLIVYEACYA